MWAIVIPAIILGYVARQRLGVWTWRHLLRVVGTSVSRAGLVAFGLQTVSLAVYAMCVWVAIRLMDHTHAQWPPVVMLAIVGLLQMPVTLLNLPNKRSRPYADIREIIESAGATRAQAKAAAWAGGPVAIAGFVCAIVGLFAVLER